MNVVRRLVWVMAVITLGWLSAGCERAPQAAAPPPPQVSTVKVTARRVVLTSELPGRTSGYLVAEIRPQVSGLLQKRLFVEGAQVAAGQLLYQIDPAVYQADYDSALANQSAAEKAADQAGAALQASQAEVARQQATLTLAQVNRQRYEDLFADKAVSASDRDQAVTNFDVASAALQAAQAQVESSRQAVAVAQAAIQQARAAVQMARVNLDYTRITAPIAGRIGRSTVTDGAIVTAYQPQALATIQQLDPIYVDVPQSTGELLRLQQHLADGAMQRDPRHANEVELILENGQKYPAAGTLQFRDVTVDATTGSVILRMVFPNPQGLLLPGMFVRAVVREGVLEQAIVVPQQAVARDTKGNPIALIVNAGHQVEQRQLSLDRALGDQWLVTGGLAVGDQVIVEGMQKVRPGMTVQPAPLATSAVSNPTPAATATPAPTTTAPAAVVPAR